MTNFPNRLTPKKIKNWLNKIGFVPGALVEVQQSISCYSQNGENIDSVSVQEGETLLFLESTSPQFLSNPKPGYGLKFLYKEQIISMTFLPLDFDANTKESELKENIVRLEKTNKAMQGRELRIIELKKELAAIRAQVKN